MSWRWPLPIDDSIARRLLGEPRVKDLIDLVRFALSHKGADSFTVSGAVALLEEVGYINRVRAIVAHKPCSTDRLALEFHNRLTAKKERSYICTAAQLKNLASRAIRVSYALRELIEFDGFSGDLYEHQARKLLASAEKSELPSDPERMSQQTQAPQAPRRPSRPKPKPQKES